MHCAVRMGILAHKDTLIQLLRCDYGVYFVFLKLNAIKESLKSQMSFILR